MSRLRSWCSSWRPWTAITFRTRSDWENGRPELPVVSWLVLHKPRSLALIFGEHCLLRIVNTHLFRLTYRTRRPPTLQFWSRNRPFWWFTGGATQGSWLHATCTLDKCANPGPCAGNRTGQLCRLLPRADVHWDDPNPVSAESSQAETRGEVCALVPHRSKVLLQGHHRRGLGASNNPLSG